MSSPPTKHLNNCLFCQQEVIGKSFYSAGGFSAVYNIAPVVPGHSLIIPERHYESLNELSNLELGDMMVFARKITRVLLKVFACNGFDWTIQDGASAGQTIPHLHLHIIPRKADDLPGAGEWYSYIPINERQLIDSESRAKLNTVQFNEITETLRQACLNHCE